MLRQQLVHALLKGMPHRPDATGRARATSLGVYRVGLAVDFEGLVLGSGHDVPDGDGRRLLGEKVAALGAPYALDQAGPAKPQQDLLDVIGGQPLQVRQLARRDRAVARAAPLGEVERDDQAVLGPGGDPHEWNMWAVATLFKRTLTSSRPTSIGRPPPRSGSHRGGSGHPGSSRPARRRDTATMTAACRSRPAPRRRAPLLRA